ncbi:unnamed protein product [Oreochromis niloticus]|nr:unnamed protein product [Mustela putorius furo]
MVYPKHQNRKVINTPTYTSTHTPDNVHSSNMTDALNTLRQIKQAQNQDYVSNTSDWFSWLYIGSWLQLLKRLLLPFHCAIRFVKNQRCNRLQYLKYLKYLQFLCILILIYSIYPFFLFLLLFCVFVTCILPCLKLMINRIIVSTVAAYIAVTNDDDDDPDRLEHEDFV